MPGLGAQALRGGIHQYFAVLGQIVAQVLVVAILSRILTAEDFGEAALATVVIAFASAVSEFGLAQGLIRTPSLDDRQVATAFWSSVASGLLVFIVMIAGSGVIADVLGHHGIKPLIVVLASSFIMVSLASTAEALLVREINFRALLVASSIAQVVAYPVVAISMALAGYGVWSLIAAALAQFAVRSGLIMLMAPHTRALVFDFGAFRELTHFGGGITLARLFNFVAISADQVIVGRMLGVNVLGVYTRALQLVRAPIVLLGTTTERVSYPLIAKVSDDAERLRDMFLTGVALAAMLALPSGVLMFVLGRDMVTLLLGNEWQGAASILQILAIALVPRIIYKLSDGLANAKGAVYQRSLREALYAVLMVTFISTGCTYGVNGAALGVLGATTTNWLVCIWQSKSLAAFSLGEYGKALLPALGPGVLVAVSWWLADMVPGDGPAMAAARIAATCTIFAGFSMVVYLGYPRLLGVRLQAVARVAADSTHDIPLVGSILGRLGSTV